MSERVLRKLRFRRVVVRTTCGCGREATHILIDGSVERPTCSTCAGAALFGKEAA